MKRLTRPRNLIIAGAAALALALVPVIPAAAQSWSALNCYSYSYKVILYATTSGPTIHRHDEPAPSYTPHPFTWNDATPTYHLTDPLYAVSANFLDAYTISGQARGCDY
ncbi:MAG TPA: hypothetical protein VNQ52_03985 [Microbacteriaceae bacterium]|nr:hypothetical protein [Microbacteriaceae bacterium]